MLLKRLRRILELNKFSADDEVLSLATPATPATQVLRLELQIGEEQLLVQLRMKR